MDLAVGMAAAPALRPVLLLLLMHLRSVVPLLLLLMHWRFVKEDGTKADPNELEVMVWTVEDLSKGDEGCPPA